MQHIISGNLIAHLTWNKNEQVTHVLIDKQEPHLDTPPPLLFVVIYQTTSLLTYIWYTVEILTINMALSQ